MMDRLCIQVREGERERTASLQAYQDFCCRSYAVASCALSVLSFFNVVCVA